MNLNNKVLNGIVIDEYNNRISAVDIYFKDINGGGSEKVNTNLKGEFKLILAELKDKVIEAKAIDFFDTSFILSFKEYDFKDTLIIRLRSIIIKIDSIIYSKPNMIQIKGDSTIYNLDGLLYGSDRLESVINKLPGLSLQNGKVYFKGKSVSKILIEGDDIFNSNMEMALKKIPANYFNELIVSENYIENPILKGFLNSKDVVIDLQIKEDYKNKFIHAGALDIGNLSKIGLDYENMSFGSNKYVNIVGWDSQPHFDESHLKVSEKNHLYVNPIFSKSTFENYAQDNLSLLKSNLVSSNSMLNMKNGGKLSLNLDGRLLKEMNSISMEIEDLKSSTFNLLNRRDNVNNNLSLINSLKYKRIQNNFSSIEMNIDGGIFNDNYNQLISSRNTFTEIKLKNHDFYMNSNMEWIYKNKDAQIWTIKGEANYSENRGRFTLIDSGQNYSQSVYLNSVDLKNIKKWSNQHQTIGYNFRSSSHNTFFYFDNLNEKSSFQLNRIIHTLNYYRNIKFSKIIAESNLDLKYFLSSRRLDIDKKLGFNGFRANFNIDLVYKPHLNHKFQAGFYTENSPYENLDIMPIPYRIDFNMNTSGWEGDGLQNFSGWKFNYLYSNLYNQFIVFFNLLYSNKKQTLREEVIYSNAEFFMNKSINPPIGSLYINSSLSKYLQPLNGTILFDFNFNKGNYILSFNNKSDLYTISNNQQKITYKSTFNSFIQFQSSVLFRTVSAVSNHNKNSNLNIDNHIKIHLKLNKVSSIAIESSLYKISRDKDRVRPLINLIGRSQINKRLDFTFKTFNILNETEFVYWDIQEFMKRKIQYEIPPRAFNIILSYRF